MRQRDAVRVADVSASSFECHLAFTPASMADTATRNNSSQARRFAHAACLTTRDP